MIEKSLVSDFMDVPELLSPSEIKIGQITLKTGLFLKNTLWYSFQFPDFTHALEFTVKAGLIAEEMQHHPEINLSWGKWL